MKIALAQINVTIGDFDGNVELILNAANRAHKLGAELVVFPEQCIPGYPAHDLLERTRFIDENLKALRRISQYMPDLGIIVGFAERSDQNWGKGLYNSVALVHKGRILSVHRKSLLPTYDIFDERRYFDPAQHIRLADFKGIKLGLTICEDVWNDPDFWSRRMYDNDPMADLIDMGADVIINLAGSPFTMEKRTLRREMLKAAAINHKRPLLFCNLVGGNDDLVFDGDSRAYDANGKLLARAKEFEEDLVIVDLDKKGAEVEESGISDDQIALNALILGTRDYAHKCGFKTAILGLSGGIDSALVAVIASEALGVDNFETVLMPSPYSSKSSVDDAMKLVGNLGAKHRLIPIDNIFKTYLNDLSEAFEGLPADETEENIQARIRGMIIMALSNKHGHLVLSTGNKSEMATGYCTLYGDMAGGLALLSDVPKTLVYRLCEVINRDREVIPQAIIDKPPSAELKPDQRDQDTLPPYDALDSIIERHVVHRLDGLALVAEGFDPDRVAQTLGLIRRSEYKRRQAPPGLKITSKAFGHGRRIPLAHRWQS